MQPHVNMGINFRKRCAVLYSSKRELNIIRKEEARINKQYRTGNMTRELAMSLLNKLFDQFIRIKGK